MNKAVMVAGVLTNFVTFAALADDPITSVRAAIAAFDSARA
jgi:hypothetical protein